MNTRCLPHLYPIIRQPDNNDTDRFQRASHERRGFQAPVFSRQAFWLTGFLLASTHRTFPSTTFDSGILPVFVPEYSNGWHAMDSHHLSF